ncbi:DUF4215 domain-containing protein [Candidatus Woesearchaeota archaeon]|nr:DUF4215 domain-containing protein [Candidatus Woesearchaeota archaeon]
MTIPQETNKILVETYGAGGGGAGGIMTCYALMLNGKIIGIGGKCGYGSGGGGGSGAYEKSVIDVQEGDTISVVVGAGGSGGSARFVPWTGGESWHGGYGGAGGQASTVTISTSQGTYVVSAAGGNAGTGGGARAAPGAGSGGNGGSGGAGATNGKNGGAGTGGGYDYKEYHSDWVFGGGYGGAGILPNIGSGGNGGTSGGASYYVANGDSGKAGSVNISSFKGDCCGLIPYEYLSEKFDEEDVQYTSYSAEQKELINGWTLMNHNGLDGTIAGVMIVNTDSNEKVSGDSSLHMNFAAETGNDAYVKKTVSFSPGTYVFSAYVKSSSLTAPRDYSAAHGVPSLVGRVYFAEPGKTPPYPVISDVFYYDASEWKKIQFEFTITQSKRLDLSIGAGYGSLKGDLWIDSILIVRKDGGDLGKTSQDGNYLCIFKGGDQLDEQNWEWKSATSSMYEILQVGTTHDAISNGMQWSACNPGLNFLPFNVLNEYTGTDLDPPFDPSYGFDDLSTYGTNLDDSYSPNQEEEYGSSILNGEVYADDVFSGVTISEPVILPYQTVSLGTGSQLGLQVIPNEAILSKIFLNLRVSSPAEEAVILKDSILVGDTDDGEFVWKSTDHNERQAKIEILQSGPASFANISEMPVLLPEGLMAGKHSLNITTVTMSAGAGIARSYVFSDAFVVPENQMIDNRVDPFKIYPGRFLCSQEGGNENSDEFIGGITECCGPVYASCKNTNKNYSRISGGPNTLVKDYYGGDFTRNRVMRVGFDVDDFSNYGYGFDDLMINSWKGYDALEFDFAIAEGRTQNLKLKITDSSGNAVFDDLVIKYSLSGNSYDDWHHVKIPLTDLMTKNRIDELFFYSLKTELISEAGTDRASQPAFGDNRYYIIFAVDRFYLTSADSSLQEQFCVSDYGKYVYVSNDGWTQETGSSKVGRWTTDLDEERDACNNVASYKWTSKTPYGDGDQTLCCGDDQGNNLLSENFYKDNGGCWNGMYVANNTVVDVSVKISETEELPEETTPDETGLCGNGIIDPGEHCDDGNTEAGDGCSPACILEECCLSFDNGICTLAKIDGTPCIGGICDGTGKCVSSCGDGIVDLGEQCDSGASNSDSIPNACRTNCKLPYCTDGVRDTGEDCDDGNAVNNDGCPNTCKLIDSDGDGEVDEADFYKTNLLFYDGEFWGCSLNSDAKSEIENKFQFMKDNAGFFDWLVNQDMWSPSVENEETLCKNKGDYYCDNLVSVPRWKDAFEYSDTEKVDTEKKLSTILESNLWPVEYYNEMEFGERKALPINNLCCPASFCLNGTTCENSSEYVNNPKKPPIFMTYGETGLRCGRDGEWHIASLKPDYYMEDTGYCTSETDCYVDATHPCLVSGNWSYEGGKDRMCMDGDWTTRTKYVAAKLLEYAEGFDEYSLYCDSAENAMDETIMAGEKSIDFNLINSESSYGYLFTGDYTNNICVLRFGSNVIVGTSLNLPINDTIYPVYRVFGFNNSEEMIVKDKKVDDYETTDDDGKERIEKIYSSTRSGELFYSSGKQVMFYSVSDVPEIDATWFESILDFVSHPIFSLGNAVSGIFAGSGHVPLETLEKYQDFDKLYVAKKGSKIILGVNEMKYDAAEGELLTSMAIQYTGFDSDVCLAVAGREKDLNVECTTATTNGIKTDTIFAAEPDESFFDNVWPDLTAKTRIK